jgi:hypothetical protein
MMWADELRPCHLPELIVADAERVRRGIARGLRRTAERLDPPQPIVIRPIVLKLNDRAVAEATVAYATRHRTPPAQSWLGRLAQRIKRAAYGPPSSTASTSQ